MNATDPTIKVCDDFDSANAEAGRMAVRQGIDQAVLQSVRRGAYIVVRQRVAEIVMADGSHDLVLIATVPAGVAGRN